jgi:hypothetical protein
LALQYGSAVCRLPLVRGMDDSGAADEPRGCFPRPHQQPDRSITLQYSTRQDNGEPTFIAKEKERGRRREKAFSALAFQRRFCLPPPEPICIMHAPACCSVSLHSTGALAPARISRSSSQEQKAPVRVSRGSFLSAFSTVSSISALNFDSGRERNFVTVAG